MPLTKCCRQQTEFLTALRRGGGGRVEASGVEGKQSGVMEQERAGRPCAVLQRSATAQAAAAAPFH